MIKNRNETSAAMDKALKNLEQAKARYEAERKKENEKRRKAQNHHKYLMGGIVATVCKGTGWTGENPDGFHSKTRCRYQRTGQTDCSPSP